MGPNNRQRNLQAHRAMPIAQAPGAAAGGRFLIATLGKPFSYIALKMHGCGMVNLISYLGHIVCSAYFGAAPKRRATLTLDCVNFVNFVRKSDSLASARITDHSGVHLEIPVLHPCPLTSARVIPLMR